MGSQTVNTNVPGQEPELRLLLADKQLDEPLYKHLFREIDEFFFPKKLPPLQLESKPEPVKDIWGFYDNKKNGVLGSTGVHVLIVGLIALSYVVFKHTVTVAAQPKVTVALVDPSGYTVIEPGQGKSSFTNPNVNIANAGWLPGGAGEPGSVPPGSAVANAFFDATGVRLRQAPMTPARVRAALKAAGK